MKDQLRRTQFLMANIRPEAIKPSISEVAFVGRSNVGKSSLLNVLCEHKGLADVSKMPGRTRMINVYAAAHGRWLIDLPGYGFALGSPELRKQWSAMIEKYLTTRPSLQAVLLIFDSQVGPTKLDFLMREWLEANHLPFILIGSKVDQLSGSKREGQKTHSAKLLNVPVTEIRWVSSSHGAGIKELRKEIIGLLSRDPTAS